MSQPPGAPAGPPVPVGQFSSSSGRTALLYYRHTFPPGGPTSFRGSLPGAAGFDQAEVFLCGFSLATDAHEAPVGRVSVNVERFSYDPQSGALEVGLTTLFATDGQGSTSEVTFVAVLTDATAAHFSTVTTSCGGTAECHITRQLGNAVLPGMQYIGIATQIWDVGLPSGGPVPVNGIAGDVDSLAVNPPTVFLDYAGALRNGAFANDMFCEWQGVVIAFDPAEMTPPVTSLPYQYTFLSVGQSHRASFFGGASPSPSAPTTGLLDALQGCTLLYSQAINGPETPIWMIEASAQAPILTPNGALTHYGVFLGSRFGDAVNAVPDFSFQLSRAVGFLH
jgi:hypothetical protein